MRYVSCCVLFISILFTNCFASRDVRWRRLADGSGLERFDNTDYAFDTSVNLRYCARRVINIQHRADIDDYEPLITAAFKQLAATGGGTVRLSAGLFYQKDQFEIPSYCCLQGAGMYNTTLKVHPHARPFRNAGAMRTYLTERVSILDLTQHGNRYLLKGPMKNRYGIYTHLANYVWMKNVRVLDNKMYGFDPHGANTEWSYFLVMEDCYSSGNGKDGFTIDQYYYVSLLNSMAENNDRHGVNIVSGARFVLIKANRFRHNGKVTGVGCSMVAQNNEFGTRSVRFIDNVGMGYRLAGICIRRTFDVEATRNKLMSFETKKVAMFQLHSIHDVQLVNNTWVKANRKYSMRGTTNYVEINTAEIQKSAQVTAEFESYFDKPVGGPPVHFNMSNTNGKRTRLTRRKLSAPHRGKNKDGDTQQDSEADPICEKGVRNAKACCPKECGKCGGKKCSSRPGGKNCCQSHIFETDRLCTETSAPCIIRR